MNKPNSNQTQRCSGSLRQIQLILTAARKADLLFRRKSTGVLEGKALELIAVILPGLRLFLFPAITLFGTFSASIPQVPVLPLFW
ncbi:hypothetical protein [Leptolyngbya sp. 7M]|uniref:hypothetical protein n=1 Tax=Leptolyngbya sp. 7M TaxID=2812896 RepID=UPI001B8A8E2F|nr:hypothetical protein [Leptolyngbya sp. 7M]QYO64700.1 hypothetical protein JVX88_34685 [Leptolyngbya sp. 7M]